MTITMFKALKEKVDIINKYMVDLIREMKTIKKEPNGNSKTEKYYV